MRRGICSARIAANNSGNGVVAVSRIAAWTDIQDFNEMAKNLSNPGWVILNAQGPMTNETNDCPGVVKTNGSAANPKAKASAARLYTYPTLIPERKTRDNMIKNNKE